MPSSSERLQRHGRTSSGRTTVLAGVPCDEVLDELRETILPRSDDAHGPLPALLVGMTLVTGLVDAFSYLALGHVFVANMTGNVVFLGFAFAGAQGFSISASLTALASFVVGALGGGRLLTAFGAHRGHLLAVPLGCRSLFSIAVLLAAVCGSPVPSRYRYALIVVLGIALGIQNTVVRRLGVPDLTTTVLTLTITGMAADARSLVEAVQCPVTPRRGRGDAARRSRRRVARAPRPHRRADRDRAGHHRDRCHHELDRGAFRTAMGAPSSMTRCYSAPTSAVPVSSHLPLRSKKCSVNVITNLASAQMN